MTSTGSTGFPVESTSDGPCEGRSDLNANILDRVRGWRRENFLARLQQGDWRLWSSEPIDEVADRLGWLHLPTSMQSEVGALEEFAAQARQAGIAQVLLLGMGGSSLAPEVFQATFGSRPGAPRVKTVDTTHPAAIELLSKDIDPKSTWVIVSSKSGTTLETASLHQYFWTLFLQALSHPAEHFIAITDPGTELEEVAQRRGYRAVFEAPSDVGGRFSALSYFGLVPAALIGVDTGRLLARARGVFADRGSGSGTAEATASESEAASVASGFDAALELGAMLGESAESGRDKLTLYSSPGLMAFPDWLEQLVAESSGKGGKGILPVVGERLAPPESYGVDRCFVALVLEEERYQKHNDQLESHLAALESRGHPVIRRTLADPYDLGSEMMVWEVAVAAACSVLGVPPFNQPDVQLAKEMARSAMRGAATRSASVRGGSGRTSSEPEPVDASVAEPELQELLQRVKSGDYIAILAYLQPTEELTTALGTLQAALGQRSGSCVTVGYGPRYLHSTGQLHKGGAANGHFLQLIDRPEADLKVPGNTYTFNQLIEAQALGDLRALRSRGQDTLRIVVSDTPVDDLTGLTASVLSESSVSSVSSAWD